MLRLKLVLNTVRHNFAKSILHTLAIAVAFMVLCGALFIGDSVKQSLLNTVSERLGKSTHAITKAEGFFTDSLSARIAESTGLTTTAIVRLTGSVVNRENQFRANQVNIIGVQDNFFHFAQDTVNRITNENTFHCNIQLANILKAKTNDRLSLIIGEQHLIPLNTPFLAENNETVTLRGKLEQILTGAQFGNFSLKNSQIQSKNLFVPLTKLQEIAKLQGLSNLVLVDSKNDKLNIAPNIELADLGFEIKSIQNDLHVISHKSIFMDETVLSKIRNITPTAYGVTTYLVNEISTDKKSTPYSFASSYAVDDSELKKGEVIVNEWLQSDLKLNIGDSIKIKYFTFNRLRNLKEDSTYFKVCNIASMSSTRNELIGASLPGLTDVDNCHDWDTGIPIDLDKIRDKDEKYWDDYNVSPKLFLSKLDAERLFTNSYGTYTQIVFSDSRALKVVKAEIINVLKSNSTSIQVNATKKSGTLAASSGVDFGGLFIGLSFFLLISAFILIYLLTQHFFSSRKKEVSTLLTCGFTPRKILSLYILEYTIYTLFGSILGFLLALFYSRGMINFMNTVWQDIVRTNTIEIHISVNSVIISLVVGILTSLLFAQISIRKLLKSSQKESGLIIPTRKLNHKILWTIRAIIFLSITHAVFYLFKLSGSGDSVKYLINVGFPTLLTGILTSVLTANQSIKTKSSLLLRNIQFVRLKSLSIVVLLALSTFLIIMVGANRIDSSLNKNTNNSGTGGFTHWVDLTRPYLSNLNQQNALKKDAFAQLYLKEGDDASCLNLNKVDKPSLIGIPSNNFAQRNSFNITKSLNQESMQEVWNKMTDSLAINSIPAVVDQTVLDWGLMIKLGTPLHYIAENGEPFSIVPIAGLQNSVFQGSILIDQKWLNYYYPSISGSSKILIDSSLIQRSVQTPKLDYVFANYGAEITLVEDRLNQFNSVTNTYLSIFLILGLLSLVLGSFGIGILTLKSVQERGDQFKILRTIGYTHTKLRHILFLEHFILLSFGLIIGTGASLLASIPAINYGFISVPQILVFVCSSLAVGTISVFLAILQLKKK